MSFADLLQKNAEETGMKKVQGKSQADADSVQADSADLGALFAANKIDTPINNITPAERRTVKRGAPEIGEDFDTGPIAIWSFSSMTNGERCPHYLNMEKVQKVPQESGDAAERGSMFHDGFEDWVRGTREKLPKDRKSKIEPLINDFNYLKEQFNAGRVQLEENWGIRKDWSPCTWDDPELWGRAKLDAFVLEEDGTSCRIIDYKTGGMFGNEMKHKDQGVTYALYAFHKYPELEFFQIEFWYVDHGKKMVFSYGRPHLAIFLPLFHERAYQITTDEEFIPTPSVYACQYCSYGCNTNKAGTKQYGNGECEFDFYKDKEAV